VFREQGVRVLPGELVQTLQPDESGVTIKTLSGETLRADGVVAGLGIRPNVALAKAAGLETGNGILVDAELRTSHPLIFAAGDVDNFYSPVLGQRMRVEHEENANLTGQLAGQAMAGQPGRYDTLPSVYSTLFDATYDAVGELDPTLEMVYDWVEPFQKGAVYYMRQGRVRGVLLWNLGKGLDTARQLISEAENLTAEDLKGRIPG
jgi:NADPH-dependent 2,4-dienoyl-CoA reductase/sulfur reductase-like enzyme